jgi:ABC-type ATPase with predicted acetyltransferase domain
MRNYVNLIVRIARVVSSPDLRGLGLAGILIDAAKEYAQNRWHIGGRRPLFMEISAEMLKYMDFATSAGLHFIGNTEGNIGRIHKDLVQMRKGQKVSFGIMTLQKKYLTDLETLAKSLNQSFHAVLSRLKELTEDGVDEVSLRTKFNRLEPQEWFLFKRVLRFPIPYFLCGLDEASEGFIAAHAKRSPSRIESARKLENIARIALKDIRGTSTYEIPDSVYARAVRDCFGLDGSIFQVTLAGPVSLEASGGNIILLTGPSGSGKSVLLGALDPNADKSGLRVSYKDACGKPYQVAWMQDIHSERPLIEYFSQRWGMESSISALNLAGLSEAFVYLRPYRLLSRGQQYRARLAALSLGPEPVWLMDEFCADLDPFTARVVASNLRKHVVRTGRIAIVGAANNAHYIDALRPTKVIYLRHNGKTEILNFKDYVDEFCTNDK